VSLRAVPFLSSPRVSREGSPPLAAEGVVCGYNGVPVLKGVSLTLPTGLVTGVVGPNGAGKTTLLKALAGVRPLSGGRVVLHGRNIATYPRKRIAREVAVVPQHTGVDFAFTVRDLVTMGRMPHQSYWGGESAPDREAVEAALTQTCTAHLADRTYNTLSGGEQRRVAIARALAQEASVLLLDEPTAHLDLQHQGGIMALVRGLAEEGGLAVMAVLHDLNLAAQFCQSIVLLREGRVQETGPPAKVVTPRQIRRAYGCEVLVGAHPLDGSPQVFLTRGQFRRHPGSADSGGTPRGEDEL